VRKALTYPDDEGWECTLVPDFAIRREEQLPVRQARFMGYGTVDHLWCVEVEGTDEGAHVRRKHQGYAALASSYDQPGRTFRLHVTIGRQAAAPDLHRPGPPEDPRAGTRPRRADHRRLHRLVTARVCGIGHTPDSA
jgi:hypothetical protein